MKGWARLFATAFAVATAACTLAPPVPPADSAAAREQLLATSWMRESLEYRFLSEEVYRAAAAALDKALAEPGTASLEQESDPGYMSLPPAVVLDIDETTIGTIDFSARLVAEGRYVDKTVLARDWPAWIRDPANGRVVPGAVEFVRAAKARGVRVIFLTNRECPLVPSDASGRAACAERKAAVQALTRVGIPDVREEDVILAGGPERWTIDKAPRRQVVAKRYRIVMLVGDDLQDLVPQSVAEKMRAGAAAEAHDRVGTRWFLLPNPVYGSWERYISRACTEDGARLEVGYECHYRAISKPVSP